MQELSEFEKFLNLRNTREILKLISLTKLIPSNHGKNLRLEIIQSLIINNLNVISEGFNYDGLINILDEHFPSNSNEDPVETSFTENFQFKNGNNIVFPGLANDSTPTLQLLINAILLHDNNLPINIKQDIEDGLIFMLHVHNTIAKKLHLVRYMAGKMVDTEIDFPDEDFYKEHKDLFEFSSEEINVIYNRFQINSNVIERFTFDRAVKINVDDFDNNPILLKPFINFENSWFLVEPTSQMYALNQFIVETLEENNVLDEVIKIYDELIVFETRKHLKKMQWLETDIVEKFREQCGFESNESIWQFDENKLAYVHVLSNADKSDGDFHKIAEDKLKLLVEQLDSTNEYMVLFVLSTYSLTEPVWFPIEDIKNCKYVQAISIHDLSRLVSFWDLDKLSIWKYLKAFQRAIDKGMFIMPTFSILTYYRWYMKNVFSFSDPDTKMDVVSFSYDMQGNVVIETNSKEDYHLLPYMSENMGYGFIPVHQSEKYAPIYLSEEVYVGQYRKALEKYTFPLWVTCDQRRDIMGRFLVDAVVYWMNEIFEFFHFYVSQLARAPIVIVLNLDEKLAGITSEQINNFQDTEFEIELEVVKSFRQITLHIPFEIYGVLHRKDNLGERILMQKVILGFSKLMLAFGHNEISDEQINSVVNSGIPLGSAKMLITADSTHNLKIDNRYIPSPRYISKADTAIVLEDVVSWMGAEVDIPEKIEDKKQKVSLFISCVNTLIGKLREAIVQYDCLELIKFLMYHHEALIQQSEFRKLYIPTRLACYKKYDNVLQEYMESETNIVSSSLAIRTLIEFIVAEPYYGNKKPNNDDVDMLMAFMNEILYYGMFQDIIKFDINDPEVGLLPSGRIGITKEFFDDVLSKYNTSNSEDDIYEYEKNFARQYKTKPKEAVRDNDEDDNYFLKVDAIFENSWGITLPEMNAISTYLSEYCFVKETSISVENHESIIDIISSASTFDEVKIERYLDIVVLETRGKMDVPPEHYEYSDILPWRYNRRLAYLRKPIIKIKDAQGEFKYLWSARFMLKYAENLANQFMSGTLRVNKDDFEIQNLLAKRNNIKGKEFNDDVRNWIKQNTHLEVIPFEVKIKLKGFFNAEKNYGDIDILCFDHERKIIYCIECKNTKQAKIIYDFQRDIDNYTDKQLPKHISRGNWIEQNLNQVTEKFNFPAENYKVVTLVISSYQLPIKFIKESEIPLYSFAEIKHKNIFGRIK